MTRVRPADGRAAALDDYLALRATEGFHVEARTTTQAVIVRTSRAFFLLVWLRTGARQERRFVSVDEHAIVTAVAADPAGR